MCAHILATAAWPYANGPRHIGHVSGFGVPSDVFARYMRMAGHQVLLVSGSDEHGTAIQVKAEAEGMTPQQTADKYHGIIVEDLAGLGLSYDLYTRTTTLNHQAVVQEIFRTLHENGYIIEQTQLGAISPSTGRTLADRYVEGVCPICGFDGARGDQCDNCGNQLDPTDLISPRSRINGEEPKFVETTHFFLDLPALADALMAWLDSRTDWRPNVLNFSYNFAKELKPRAITRDLDWGVPVPVEGWQDEDMKRIYVWFDAVIGYLSASIEWARRTGRPDAWKAWWQDPQARSYYFMGKDNIVFHSVIWPSMLLGLNGEGSHGGARSAELGTLNLPTEVVSSEFLTMKGSKVDTSHGVVIYVGDFIREFGPDTLRYYIAVAGPENKDTDFTWDEFVRRNNNELANEWGNLVNRSISMAFKNNGAIPEAGERTQVDLELLDAAQDAFGTVGGLIEQCRFKAAITEAMRIVGLANQYISQQEPWKLKDDPARRDTVLNTALQVVQDANTLLTPFMPHAAQKIFEMLGGEGVWAAQPQIRQVTEGQGEAEHGYPVLMGDYASQQAVWASRPVVPGTPLSKPVPLFRKLDEALAANGPEWARI
ncbi:methionine--tRNA ligase [Propionibacterium australiense]|uniref:Methionine--tRNA ligase n=1 Tax=Propionibacterium australiense TaxID=119981 RepID=A0A383S5Z4_9ACTN|nr:methionine--tRNA ligase [Propionibacterium australiense]RLP10696.1 methionine--tRNA ligase [Propionibacterium australiense]RLP13116.1 methionine--tRNA ligase [Propionibacterium australiense]SYZ32789.1 Methionine-tRNA ligase [Propionibacterium australiense]VEH91250.1 Methionine--tRNA ligase [Propionibacterium australiense]